MTSDTLLDTERRPEVVAGSRGVECHDAGVSKPLLDGGKLS